MAKAWGQPAHPSYSSDLALCHSQTELPGELPRKKKKKKIWCSLSSSSQMGSVAQSCPTPCDLMDCSPPGSSVRGISLARILEWVAISSFRGSSQTRDRTYTCSLPPSCQGSPPPYNPSNPWSFQTQEVLRKVIFAVEKSDGAEARIWVWREATDRCGAWGQSAT